MEEELKKIEEMFKKARETKPHRIIIEGPEEEPVLSVLSDHAAHRLGFPEDEDLHRLLDFDDVITLEEGRQKIKIEKREGKDSLTSFYGNIAGYPFSGIVQHSPIQPNVGRDGIVDAYHNYNAVLRTEKGYYLHGANSEHHLGSGPKAFRVPISKIEIWLKGGNIEIKRVYESLKGDKREEERLEEIERKIAPIIGKIAEHLNVDQSYFGVEKYDLSWESRKPVVRQMLKALEGENAEFIARSLVKRYSVRVKSQPTELHGHFNTLMLEMARRIYEDKKIDDIVEQLKEIRESLK